MLQGTHGAGISLSPVCNRTKNMRPRLFCAILVAVTLALASSAGALSLDEVNKAELTKPSAKDSRAVNLKAQVLLDRLGFSSGAIDGRRSDNFASALRAFQEQNGLSTSGALDAATWKKLTESPEPALIEYTIGAVDTKGPFVAEIPDSYEKKAELKRLDYTGPIELLAERFHMNEDLLRQLNRDKSFAQAGTVITVANVGVKPVALRTKVAKVEVDKTRKSVRALAADGKLLAFYPASIGSEEKPAPSGKLKVVRVARGPTYTYNPEFKFRGVKADRELKIAAGPNNPVGAVWIALNEKTYGIHGTAEPAKVGKVDSHGCVRMTNWDALALASLVRKGTVVEFIE
jgi:lipoprotein-anchoring transpeptidase ErfK/SrfK